LTDHGFTDERPFHEVRIARRFAVGRYPVTFEDYDAYCDATGQPPPEDGGWGRGRRPVINVSWKDARDYANWLSAETGNVGDERYRLLTEAEWEYACRAGTRTSYSWGNREPTERDANFGRNVGRTMEVGSYPPNPWGLYDMHGNVWEWTRDVKAGRYKGAPVDGSAWGKRPELGNRVLRGCSWYFYQWHLRSPSRFGSDHDNRIVYIGFRLARTL
jgi:formylglycine-generating enzyme required for sulfatase activity